MSRSRFLPVFITLATILLAVASLMAMGREPICTCGVIKLWHGQTMSSENSQHISDWYTPSHVLHGIIFYGIFFLVAARLAVGWRLVLATVIEAGWEVLENTNAVIEHYRTATISLDYYGDSILNSTFDILAMIAGFWFARFVHVWVAVATVVLAELVTLYVIRDGLALNIIMLLYPLEIIKDWQAS